MPVRTPLTLALLFFALAAGAADPPKARITVKEYRPMGLLPSDLEAFLNGFGDKLAPAEKAHLRDQWQTFKTAWEAFELANEKPYRKALADLGSADPAVVAAARAELTRMMKGYPSSFTVFRAAVARLSPENAVRLTTFCMDFINARDVWLKRTQDITTAIGANAFQKNMADAAASQARQGAIAVRESLKHMRMWKDQITKNDDPNLLTISRTMDFYERTDARAINRLIDQAPTLLGPDLHKKAQFEVMQRMPKRPEVVAE
jgi:hypothetical protein